MSEIDIEAVRTDLNWVRDNALSALDQLAKENERLTKERDEKDKQLREQALQYLATDGQAIDLMDRLAAMQEAIVEALHRAEIGAPAKLPGLMTVSEWATEPLRPHLPTPEPAPVDPLVEVFRSLPLHGDAGCDKLTDAEWVMVAEAARNILEVRKIGEGE